MLSRWEAIEVGSRLVVLVVEECGVVLFKKLARQASKGRHMIELPLSADLKTLLLDHASCLLNWQTMLHTIKEVKDVLHRKNKGGSLECDRRVLAYHGFFG